MIGIKKDVTTDEWAVYLEEKRITLENIKFHVNKLNDDQSMLKSLFALQVTDFNKVSIEKHKDNDVCLFLEVNMGLNLLYAWRERPMILAKVNYKDLPRKLREMNQENCVQMEFRGGRIPQIHLAKVPQDIEDNGYNYAIDSDEDDVLADENVVPKEYYTSKEHEVKIEILAGTYVVTSEVSQKMMKGFNFGEIDKVTDRMVVFADACVASDIDTGDRVGVYEVLQDNHRDELSGKVLSILSDETYDHKNSQKFDILQMLSDNSDLENRIVRGPIMFGDTTSYMDDFKTFLLQEMEMMNLSLIMSMGEYFNVYKYYDVGEPVLNLPMMWTPVLAYIEGIAPYYREGNSIMSNDNYDRGSKILYYGFSNGKLDALMKSYYARVDCFDDTGKYKGLFEHGIRRTKIPYCSPGDFEYYYRQGEHVLVLNSYPKSWRYGGGNKEMMRYVSNVLQGKIPSGERTFETQGLKLAIRMVMPFKLNLGLMKGCYPFVVMDTCSPVDVEIIIVKLFDEDYEGIETHDSRLYTMKMMFPGAELKSRMRVVRDKQEFITFLRVIRSRRIYSLILRMDNTKEWHRTVFGENNRKWFLASSQIPYVCPILPKSKMKFLNECDSDDFS